MIDPETLIKKTIERIKNGTLTDFSPLIALFQYERKPMTLDGHFMFLPFFSVTRPKYLTLRCGRQVSKSFTLAETLILTTGMIESFNSIYIAPRYDQLKRFNTQVLAPMLKTPSIRDFLVDRSGSDAIEMKAFLNGNTLMLEHSFSSPDRVRGASNCAAMALDESVTFDTEILVFRLTVAKDGVYYISDRPEIIPISEVKQGDIVLSFTSDGCIYSPVVRDASYHGRRAIFKVTTQSGRVLECTADHRIHTNLGGMRLSEVIEYGCNGRDGAPAGAEGRTQRLCFKRDCRNIIRRRVHNKARKTGKTCVCCEYDAQYKTKRLFRVQSSVIVRARYTSNIRSAEQRLQSRLISKDVDRGYCDIFIACADGVPSGGVQKDDYGRVIDVNHAPGGPGAMVRGRRNAYQRTKLRKYCYKRVHRSRGGATKGVVAKCVEYPIPRTGGDTLEYEETFTYINDSCPWVYSAVEASDRLVTGVDEVQTSAIGTAVPRVRKNIPQTGAQSELFRQLSKEVLADARARTLRDDQRGAKKSAKSICRAIPRESSGGNTCESSQKICGDVSRRTTSPKPTGYGLSGEKERVLSAKSARTLSAKKGRSTGVGEISAESQGIQGVGKSGSREVSAIERPSTIVPAAQAGKEAACAGTGGFIYDRIVSIEYVGESDVYDIEVVGTHNYILANGMCSYNCQDINPDFLPVFESTTDASRYGIIQASGTPKTTDTLLELQFSRSSQCHWAIKCSCGKWNIADIDEQLIKMVGKTGLSCAECGKLLDPRAGGWLPKYPDRMGYHAGYHVPQIILPMHCENPVKWQVLRARQTSWTKTRFFNEVLGTPDDAETKLLTKADLEKSQTPWENTLESAAKHAKDFDTVFVGVDWSGGGGGFSRTAVAVLAKQNYSDETYVLYVDAFPHGLTPEEEADKVSHIFSSVKGYMLAHDYTGAGFVRESVLLGRHPYLRNKIYPFAYVFRTGKQLVSYQESGSRRSANVDKTRSLLLTFNAIRSRRLRLPKFNVNSPTEPALELLNIVERPQEFSKASIKDVYILQRAAGRYDDAAHAINIGYIALCDITDTWPDFSVDPKYEMTPAALQEITGSSDGSAQLFT